MTPYYDNGGIQIFHGDCRDVLPNVGTPDSIITDPPYSLACEFGVQNRIDGRRRLEFDWDKGCPPAYVAERIGLALSTASKKASFFVFCGTDQVGDLLPVFRAAGFTPKPAAWVKECPPPAMPGTWWPSGFEIAFYGYRSGAWFGDTNTKRSNVFVSDSYRYGQPGKLPHPTQKPLRLISRIVASLVPPDGLVLDPFGGSGTTMRAAKDLGRRGIMCEVEEKYCEVAANRLRQEVLEFSA